MCHEFQTHIASVGAGLNPESEISKGEAREPKVDPPSPRDQEAAPSAADGQGASPESREAATGSPPRQARPKRKYTVTDKVRAASPANLKQARKAYVFTPARRAAAMKALEKANTAPPEKRNRLTKLRLLGCEGTGNRVQGIGSGASPSSPMRLGFRSQPNEKTGTPKGSLLRSCPLSPVPRPLSSVPCSLNLCWA
jgi:hypothetical protein